MIIGNNNNFNNNNFTNKFKHYQENGENIQNGNIFVKDIKDQKYSNINNKEDMYNKSLAMLQERLNKGTITIDEFKKQCQNLAKQRKN